MAIVQMKCPNCGAGMIMRNNQYECPFCHTLLLNIIDAKIDGDVTIMGGDEFVKKLEESKKQFIININDKLEVLDVNTMVINKKLKDAQIFLDAGDYKKTKEMLKGVPLKIFSCVRLWLLSSLQVHNEAELLLYDGKIDDNSDYKSVIELADEETRNTYERIAEICSLRVKIKEEVAKVEELWKVNLKQEAVAYAKSMCQRYPQSASCWIKLYEIKERIDSTYRGDLEYERMIRCPDYKGEIPPKIKKSFKLCDQLSADLFPELVYKSLSLLCCIVAISFLIYFIGLIEGLWSRSNTGFLGVIFWSYFPPLMALAGAIATIVFFVKSMSWSLAPFDYFYTVKKFKKAVKCIPKSEQNKYTCDFKNRKKKAFKGNVLSVFLVLALVGLILGTIKFIPFLIRPSYKGIQYSVANFSSSEGYEITEINLNQETIIIPERFLFSKVVEIQPSAFLENNEIIEIVLPEEVAKNTKSLEECQKLKRIFIDAKRPQPDEKDYSDWEYCWDRYGTSASIYWSGEWKMIEGKPTVV